MSKINILIVGASGRMGQKLIQEIAADKDLALVAAIDHKSSEKLGRDGRLIVRPSGTEAVIRVMAEGDDSHLVETLVTQVCNALKETEEAA